MYNLYDFYYYIFYKNGFSLHVRTSLEQIQNNLIVHAKTMPFIQPCGMSLKSFFPNVISIAAERTKKMCAIDREKVSNINFCNSSFDWILSKNRNTRMWQFHCLRTVLFAASFIPRQIINCSFIHRPPSSSSFKPQ